MQSAFSIKDALRYGWEMTKKHFGFLILLTLGFFIVNTILVQASKGDSMPLLFSVANVFVNYLAMFAFVRITLKIYKGETPRTSDIFTFDWKQFWFYFLGAVLTMFFTMVGVILFVIPGIIVAVRLGFAGFALVDENLGPLRSIRRSWQLTKGRFWILLGFSISLVIVNMIGAILLGVGLLVTSPLCLIAMAYVYQKLKAAPVPVAVSAVSA